MSRTVRCLHERKHAGRANRYGSRLDCRLLVRLRRKPRLMDPNQGTWVYGHWTFEDTSEVHTYQYNRHGAGFAMLRRYTPCEPREKYSDGWYADDYKIGWVFVQNPAFSLDVFEEYSEWLRVHDMVHRNGTACRQRIHAIAHEKRLLTRERRNANRVLTRKLLREYWIGDSE